MLYKYLPVPSDKMGVLWALSSIKDAFVVEYGPAGTTHYGIESYSKLNSDLAVSLFTTHIEENDIVMGDDARLKQVLQELDTVHSPSFIFVVASSISSVIGFDLQAVCNTLKPLVNAKLIPFTGGGFKGSFNAGVKEVMTRLASDVVAGFSQKDLSSYNIIGSNADCYNFASDIREIELIMSKAFDMRLNTVFTAGSSIEQISRASEARFNLVLRSEGITCAEIMRNKHGLEYYYGVPYGFAGTSAWIRNIQERFKLKCEEDFLNKKGLEYKDNMLKWKMHTRGSKHMSAAISGNYDQVVNTIRFLDQELGIKIVAAFVNHDPNPDSNGAETNKFVTPILFNPREQQKERILSETNPDFLFGDDVLFRMHDVARLKVQIANPNFDRVLICRHTPLMGFNGADFLLEQIINAYD